MEDAFLSVRQVTKSYPSTQTGTAPLCVLDDISMNINKGEFVTIFGPNGCGKTTVLNVISGLMEQDKGTVLINQRPPTEASIGYVFQNYTESLLPWKKSIDNIAFPLELRGMRRHERREKSSELLSRLGLSIPTNHYPYQLSGGQQQMLVIARALIHNPDVLLMDEPFSALNFQTRLYMQDKLQEIWSKTKITLLFVSHDIEEAIYLADRVLVLTDKPCKIAKSFEVNLPRPRTRAMTFNQDFLELKKETLKLVRAVVL